MTGYYTADYLYNEFKALAGMRKSNPAYSNDSTYWDDGHCNWGGMHVLKTDCQTMARGFAKLESLDSENFIKQLTETTNKDQFDSKKSNLLQKINEINSELHVKTGYSSSVFGVCCIWGQEGMSYHVENKMQECREKLDRLKSQLQGETYQWVTELHRLELEIRKIDQKMKENKQKALKETDPIKKQALIADIEKDGKLLQQKYREHQEHSNKYNFNASKYVSEIVEGMKKAIEKSSNKSRGNGGGGGGGGGGSDSNKPNKPRDPNDPFGDNWGDIPNNPNDNTNPRVPRGKKEEKKEKDNSQMLLIIVAVIVIFFLMSQKDNHSSHRRDYDEFDYY